MNHRVSRAFRPALDRVEDRCLASVHPLVSHLGVHAVTASIHHPARAAHQPGPITAEGFMGHHKPQHARPPHGRPPVVLNGGGGQGGLPSNYHDWGVITIWNTTNQNVAFSISASTYQSGQPYNFTLRPGQFQSYYASFGNSHSAPVFRVGFNVNQPNYANPVPQINTIFENQNWYPAVGTEGYPYAIASNGSGLYLTPI
jgi:hypothetical protein